MDCEKYDKICLDLLYEELDELTEAAALRHVAQCQRCRGIHSELKATRSIGVLPLLEPPQGFEQRVMAAEQRERANLPWGQRLGRTVSVLAEYAMRPELGMGALLLLLIGSSLYFLNAAPRPEARNGVPPLAGNEAIPVTPAPKPASDVPSAAQAKAESESLTLGMSLYQEGKFADAEAVLRRVEALGGMDASHAALYAAQSLRNRSDCAAALPAFDAVVRRYPESADAVDARFRAGNCRRASGDTPGAIADYESIARDIKFGERARAALREIFGNR